MLESLIRPAVIVLLLIDSLPAAAARAQEAPPTGYTYRQPVQTDDGWQTASLEEVGMDPQWMVLFMNTLARRPQHWLHGVVVVKDGKLVFEEYFDGTDLDLSQFNTSFALTYVTRAFGRDTLHSVASVSKSVTSVLLGIAVDEGLVQDTDETLLSFFPDYAQSFDSLKSRITLAHLLTMTSGLPWTEAASFDDPRNDLVAMAARADPLGYVLAAPATAEPGAQFIYSSGTTNLLGEIIRRKSGMTLAEYAMLHLFAPLGIEQYQWYAFPYAPEVTVASSALYLRPRDMAKIGQLYLDGGVWNGTRVVSEQWVTSSTQPAVELPPEVSLPDVMSDYGFQWWLGTFPAGHTRTYYAAGHGGQYIFVLPELRMVVAITAGGWDAAGNYEPLVQVVNDYVLRAAGFR